ncbi:MULTISPECIES: DinB family protein [unclassified Streptomyces]|uniref:DinB family protein n=1 Tax=unclassified Streptomyces TaxID=2593676 RepID=UPI003664D0BE
MAGEVAWQGLTLGLFHRIRSGLIHSVEGLGEAALGWRPTPDSNSVGWLTWHVARGQDRNLAELLGASQLWLTDGWAGLFGRPADPYDTGLGHSAKEAVAFRSPGSADLLAYQGAVHELAERYLSEAPRDDLSRIVASPTLGNVHSVEERLQGLITDCLAHLGQIAMLRGLMPGDIR